MPDWHGSEVRRFAVYGAGAVGAGANMAFRARALQRLGPFDVALGTGTPARGGEDLAAFIRLLWHGGAIGYEPGAVVFHTHRADYPSLRDQLGAYGLGFTATLTSLVVEDPRHLLGVATQLPRALLARARRRGAPSASPARPTDQPAVPAELRSLERRGGATRARRLSAQPPGRPACNGPVTPRQLLAVVRRRGRDLLLRSRHAGEVVVGRGAAALSARGRRALPPPPPGGCTGGVLNVMAHPDDDLFFVNPDLQAGICTTTVYVTSEAPGSAAPTTAPASGASPLPTRRWPAAIRTLDGERPHADGDHSDHPTVARLTAEARNRTAADVPLTGYVGYPSAALPVNVSGPALASKTAAVTGIRAARQAPGPDLGGRVVPAGGGMAAAPTSGRRLKDRHLGRL